MRPGCHVTLGRSLYKAGALAPRSLGRLLDGVLGPLRHAAAQGQHILNRDLKTSMVAPVSSAAWEQTSKVPADDLYFYLFKATRSGLSQCNSVTYYLRQ